jgi:threonine 3-dehydrogenase
VAQKMRAVQKVRLEPGFDLVEVDIPQIKDDEVLLKVEATAICGSDLHFYNWDTYAQKRLKPPVTMGHEFAGELVAIGKDVKNFKVGDYATADSHIACGHCPVCKIGLQHICQDLKIFGNQVDGSFAEYIAVPENSLWRLSRDVPAEIAAIMEPLGGGVQATLIEPVTGQSVVIFGDGPIGLFAAGVARAAGASSVAVVGIVPSRLEVAKQMGADTVYNAIEQKDVVDQIRSRTRGLGADVVVELSGAHTAINDAFSSVRKGGRVTLFGISPSPMPEFDFNNQVILRQVRVRGVAGRHMWDTWQMMDGLLQSGKLDPRPVITDDMPLADFDEGFKRLTTGARSSLKVILRP